MYIELYGLPGAGKSTQAALLSRKLKGINRLQAIDNKSYNLQVLGNILMSPGFAMKIMWMGIRISKRGIWRQALGCIHDFYLSLYFWKKYAKTGLFVSDHGFVQILTQAPHLREFLVSHPDRLRSLIRGMPTGNAKYIFVSLPKKQAQLRRKEDVHDETVYRESEIVFNKANPIIRPLQIDASKSISEIMESIVTHLKKQ